MRLGLFRWWLSAHHYSPATVEAYVRAVRRALEFLTESPAGPASSLVPVQRISPEQLRGFLATVPPTSSSVNMARQGLLACGRFLEEETGRAVPAAVAKLEPIPRERRLPRPLSPREMRRLLRAARAVGGSAEVLVLLLASSGCRFSEARLARWGQVHLDGAGSAWRISGKGAARAGPRERVVPLHSALVPVLARWRVSCGSAELVFPSPRRSRVGEAASGATLREWWREVCERAGVDAVPHQLRHTAATVMLDRSRDVRAVQEVLGHASLATTQLYTKVLPGRLRDAVESLPV